MPHEGINVGFLDIFALALILFLFVRGWFRGISRELTSLVGLIVGLGIAFKYYPSLAGGLRLRFPSIASFSSLISFALIFFLVLVFFSLLGVLLHKILKAVWLGWLDKWGGALFGVAEALVILSVLFFVISVLPEVTLLKTLRESSLFYGIFKKYAFPYVRRVIGELKWM